MSVETHRVVIGACGWKHAAWLNDFYEEDLPEDWQLGFYANEFPVVYVPAADWLIDADMDLSEWTEDVADSFRFILELPVELLSDAAAYNAALKRVKGLGTFCLGLVLVVNQTLCNDMALLQKCIDKAKAVNMVCLELRNVVITDEINDLLTENAVSKVWYADTSEQDNKTEAAINLAVTRISSENLAMPDLRKALEHCLSISNDRCISVLILDGEPPLIETIRNADRLLNLL